MYIGNKEVSKVYLGNKDVSNLYIGTLGSKLNLLLNAKAAFSLRKIPGCKSDYAVQVRRISDNATLDIGFVGNDLDTATLQYFAEATTVHVIKWYDQTGNGNYLEMTNVTYQPFIVITGTIQKTNNKPTINFTADTRRYLKASRLITENKWGVFAAIEPFTTDVTLRVICGQHPGIATAGRTLMLTIGGKKAGLGIYVTGETQYYNTQGIEATGLVVSSFANQDNYYVSTNGVLEKVAENLPYTMINNDFYVGNLGPSSSPVDYNFPGKMSELIVFDDEAIINKRTIIESNIEKYHFENATLFTDATTDGESSILNVQNYDAVEIDVTQNQRAILDAYASNDFATWTKLNSKSYDTATLFERIYGFRKYQVDVSEYKYFKTDLIFSDYSGLKFSANAKLLKSISAISGLDVVAKNTLAPSVVPVTSVINTLNAGFSAGKTEGEIFAFYGTQLRQSVDDGVSFSMIHNFTPLFPCQINLLSNNSMIVSMTDGSIWKSAINDFTAWTKVLQFETSGAKSSMNFGTTHYNNIVGMCEYGANNGANNARRAYISEDYGATFTKIYEGQNTAEGGTWHLHDICYDPYSEILWMSNGDGYSSANILYSFDLGQTWNKVYADGYCPTQITGIVALPNCVLFTTDVKNVGVWRWDRLKNLSANSTIVIEHALSIYDDYPGSELIGTRIGKTYGTGAIAYFGFSYFANNVFTPCKIYGTSDGYNFHALWESAALPQASAGTCGILGIADPSEEGNILATYVSNDGLTSSYNLVKINNPVWA